MGQTQMSFTDYCQEEPLIHSYVVQNKSCRWYFVTVLCRRVYMVIGLTYVFQKTTTNRIFFLLEESSDTWL